MTISQTAAVSTPSSAGSPPNSPSSSSAASPKPSPTTGLPTNPPNHPTSSGASLVPASAFPPSSGSGVTWTTPDAGATSLTRAKSSSTSCPGPTTTATSNSSAGTFPPQRASHAANPSFRPTIRHCIHAIKPPETEPYPTLPLRCPPAPQMRYSFRRRNAAITGGQP